MSSGVEISRSHRYLCEMSKTRQTSISTALITALLGQQPSLHAAQQISGIGKTTFYTHFSTSDLRQREGLDIRVRYAPTGAYLAIDFVTVPHTGHQIQGLNYHYHSSKNATCLSHQFTSTALVKRDHDPLPLEWRFKVSKALETKTYPYQTPTQAMKTVVNDCRQAKVSFAGVLLDGEFGRDEVLEFSVTQGIAVLIRAKNNMVVEFEGEPLSLKRLSERFDSQQGHLYQDVYWRAKRLPVKRKGLSFDLIIIWRSVYGTWTPFFLFSTFGSRVSLHELLRAWKARWGIEVIHRFTKQSLGAGLCQCIDIQGHENWLYCVLEAFHRVLLIRRTVEGISWRRAKQLAHQEAQQLVKTENFPVSPRSDAA